MRLLLLTFVLLVAASPVLGVASPRLETGAKRKLLATLVGGLSTTSDKGFTDADADPSQQFVTAKQTGCAGAFCTDKGDHDYAGLDLKQKAAGGIHARGEKSSGKTAVATAAIGPPDIDLHPLELHPIEPLQPVFPIRTLPKRVLKRTVKAGKSLVKNAGIVLGNVKKVKNYVKDYPDSSPGTGMTFAYNGASGLAMDARVHSMATVDVYKKESLPSPRKVANVTASIEGEGTSCQAAGGTKVNVKPAVKTAVNVARALGKNGIIDIIMNIPDFTLEDINDCVVPVPDLPPLPDPSEQPEIDPSRFDPSKVGKAVDKVREVVSKIEPNITEDNVLAAGLSRSSERSRLRASSQAELDPEADLTKARSTAEILGNGGGGGYSLGLSFSGSVFGGIASAGHAGRGRGGTLEQNSVGMLQGSTSTSESMASLTDSARAGALGFSFAAMDSGKPVPGTPLTLTQMLSLTGLGVGVGMGGGPALATVHSRSRTEPGSEKPLETSDSSAEVASPGAPALAFGLGVTQSSPTLQNLRGSLGAVGAGVSRGGGSASAQASGRSKTADSYKDPILGLNWLVEGTGNIATGEVKVNGIGAAGAVSAGSSLLKEPLYSRRFAGYALTDGTSAITSASAKTVDKPFTIDVLELAKKFSPILIPSIVKPVLDKLGIPYKFTIPGGLPYSTASAGGSGFLTIPPPPLGNPGQASRDEVLCPLVGPLAASYDVDYFLCPSGPRGGLDLTEIEKFLDEIFKDILDAYCKADFLDIIC